VITIVEDAQQRAIQPYNIIHYSMQELQQEAEHSTQQGRLDSQGQKQHPSTPTTINKPMTEMSLGDNP
jgi:hypothetical protein